LCLGRVSLFSGLRFNFPPRFPLPGSCSPTRIPRAGRSEGPALGAAPGGFAPQAAALGLSAWAGFPAHWGRARGRGDRPQGAFASLVGLFPLQPVCRDPAFSEGCLGVSCLPHHSQKGCISIIPFCLFVKRCCKPPEPQY